MQNTWIVLTQQIFTDNEGRMEIKTFWDRRSYDNLKAAITAGSLLWRDDFFIGRVKAKVLLEVVSPHNNSILAGLDLSKIEKQIHL